ncbi:MAG: hypothetical protein ACLFRP_10075 [Puniceicoccaceae bacterium]
MSEAPVRFRRTPKTPFVVGNILLAALAAALVFFGPEPFSMNTVLMVALCLFTGGLLTLLPFLLDQFAILNVQRSRVTQAAVNLKGALERSEGILAELRERGSEDSPLRVVAERLPELVETKLAEALARADAGAAGKREEIRSGIESLRPVPDALERLHDDVRTLSAHAATRERVATGLDRLSEEIDGINVRIEELRRLRLFGTPAGTGPVETPPEGSVPAGPPGGGNAAPHSATPTRRRSTNTPTPPGEPEEDAPGQSDPPKRPSSPREEAPRAAPEEQTAPPRAKSNRTSLVVSAFVGIRNGVFLRGDGPGLSETEGVRLEMTGIGEWTWSGEPGEPFTAELLLNDETPADLGSFTVNPGDTLKLNPSFPTEAC